MAWLAVVIEVLQLPLAGQQGQPMVQLGSGRGRKVHHATRGEAIDANLADLRPPREVGFEGCEFRTIKGNPEAQARRTLEGNG